MTHLTCCVLAIFSLQTLSSEFYTLIPHNFGMKLPPCIDTYAMLAQKVQLVQMLGDMRLADSIIRNADRHRLDTQNPLDLCYQSLRSDIRVIDRDSVEFETIEK